MIAEADIPDNKYIKLSLSEARALCRVLMYQYISYEDVEASKVVTLLYRFVEQNELDRKHSPSA